MWVVWLGASSAEGHGGHTDLWQSLGPAALGGLAAVFGVRAERARKQGFATGRPTVFISVGIGLTVLLVLGLIALVKLAIALAR